MREVTDKYQLMWNGLRMDIQREIREYQEAENLLGQMDEYAEIHVDTLEGILQKMEGEEQND